MRQRIDDRDRPRLQPEALIADEPTTALDVTVQARSSTSSRLRREHDMGMIMITHDMGVIAETADEVAVMYAGQFVEQAETQELFDHPGIRTEALLEALPQLEGEGIRHGRLRLIPGRPPDLISPPQYCRFAPRCPHADLGDGCAEQLRTWKPIRPGHLVRSRHPASQREAVPA